MQQSILFKASGRSSKSPIVILRGIDLSRKSSTNHFPGAAKMLSRTLSVAWSRTWCNCTPLHKALHKALHIVLHIARALFSARVSTIVAVACVAAMWWHNITICNTLEAQKAIGLDCLCALPWALVWTIRATSAGSKKGGEQ